MYQSIFLHDQVVRAPAELLLIFEVAEDDFLAGVDAEELVGDGGVPAEEGWVGFCCVGAAAGVGEDGAP